MCTIPFVRWISNAAARFSATRGAVSAQARQAGCSRQAIYDQARKVHSAVEAEYADGPTREQLIRENRALRDENDRLWRWVDSAVEFTAGKQQRFAATAAAMGLSVTQVRILLALLAGPYEAPSRSTIGRWARAAGVAAGRVLARLDARCRALVLVGCLDEIFFHGRPVLVGVEPASLTWFVGDEGRPPDGLGLGPAAGGLGRPAARRRRRRRAPAGGDRPGAGATAPRGPAAPGLDPGRVPHQARGPPGLGHRLEPRGTGLGGLRGGRG